MNNIFEKYLKNLIKLNGPISVAQFMLEHANNPKFNYYANEKPKIGAKGDFVTSPEISQVFGELIGLWCANIWWLMGSPSKFNLIELGPGNGTLISDALRALKIVPNFINAADIHLVENSDFLQKEQKKKLNSDYEIFWTKKISTISNKPNIIVSNEFLDTFPIHQYELTNFGWVEKYIGLNHLDDFCFTNNKVSKNFLPESSSLPYGSIIEFSPSLNNFFEEISIKLKESGGFGLFIDYGYEKPTYRSTISSISDHQFVDIFKDIGNTDLSAHVNFGMLVSLAEKLKMFNYGIIKQGTFLSKLGIAQRTEKLIYENPSMKKVILNSTHKLIHDQEMGKIFKVLAISDKNFNPIPGF